MQSRRVAPHSFTGRILVVDDDELVLRAWSRILAGRGHRITACSSGREAVEALSRDSYDLVLADISMPGMDGIELLRQVRQHDRDLPVVLITGAPDVGSAIEAVRLGAFRYLRKPVDNRKLEQVVSDACRLHRLAVAKREAIEQLGGEEQLLGDRTDLEATFQAALSSLYVAFQPIVDWSRREVFGYEALVRSREPRLRTPAGLLAAAERLDRLRDLGRRVRSLTAEAIPGLPPESTLFVNLHPKDLEDPQLIDKEAPLTRHASRIVLEITERTSLEKIPAVPERIAALREIGFRIAIDDLGQGYAGLSAFATLTPEVVKLDLSLIHQLDRDATQQRLVKAMAELCRELGIIVVAEGVETAEERDMSSRLGCDLLQGFLFGKPDEQPSCPKGLLPEPQKNA